MSGPLPMHRLKWGVVFLGVAAFAAIGGLRVARTVFAQQSLKTAGVKVDLDSILIHRFKQFAPGTTKPVAAESQMRVRLQVRTADNYEPIEYLELKVEQATDDTGADVLRGKQDGFFGLGSTLIAPEERAARSFAVELPSMAVPAAGARKLKVLAGSMKVKLGANVRQVKLAPLPLAKGKVLTHPQLPAIKVQIVGADAGQFAVKLAGQIGGVSEVGLVNAAGAPILPRASQFSREGDVATWTLDFGNLKALPANSALFVSIADKVWETSAPFRFDNVELP